MTIQLYTDTCVQCSRMVTQSYSTSFSLGIRTLSRKFHGPIYGIYGFVRFADEIVDTFHAHAQEALLDEFERDTWRAIESGLSLNPILQSFQSVVHKYNIDKTLIESFLHSMRMDLKPQEYERGLYEKYIYGSAEAVGLMCLQVFCEGDTALYKMLQEPARRLGAAFQKVNFLRDVQSDFKERGRTYFPGINLAEFTNTDKLAIEKDILQDFELARAGIRQLPKGARGGVFVAYKYYRKLFDKIRKLPARDILQTRIRVPDNQKFALLVGSLLRSKLNCI